MAKDSDKLTLPKRRKVELDHAIRQGFDTDAIERRVEKLRLAALAVAKKYRGDFGHLSGCSGNKEWLELRDRWEGFSVEEILKLVEDWPTQPKIKHVWLQA